VLGGNQRSPSLSRLCRVDLNYLVSVEEAMNRLQCHLVFAFLFLMTLPIDLIAQGGSAPVIYSATINYQADPWQVIITGRNFKPANTAPTILFGDVKLTSVAGFSDTSVVAWLPPDPPAGTYLLTVTNSKKVSGTGFVTFGAAGPPGEGFDQPVEWYVNCDADPPGSVNAALSEAGNRASRTTLTITGFCREDVNIDRSNITLRAASDDAGFNRLSLNLGAQGIQVENLRIAQQLVAGDGASFRAENLRMDQGTWSGILISGAASGILVNPKLTNCYETCIEVGTGSYLSVYEGQLGALAGDSGRVGIMIGGGASAEIYFTKIQGLRGEGVGVGNNSFLYVDRATIEGNGGPGIYANGGVTLNQATISNNGHGIFLEPGGSAEVMADSKILGNSGAGIWINPGCLAHVRDTEIRFNETGVRAISGALVANEGTTISDNTSRGIEARGSSTLTLTDSYVESNGYDGILLEDLSFLDVSGGMVFSAKVRNNAGWGLACSTEPIAKHYRANSGLDVSGNTGGQILCGQVTQ
jgi:hypothetical protein